MVETMHPDIDMLAAYVQDALPEEPARQLELHLGRCDVCAERLRKEARLEVSLQLTAVARRRKRCLRLARVTAWTQVAAALTLWLSVGDDPTRPLPTAEAKAAAVQAPAPSGSCPAELSGAYCSEEGASMIAIEQAVSLPSEAATPQWCAASSTAAVCEAISFTPLDAKPNG